MKTLYHLGEWAYDNHPALAEFTDLQTQESHTLFLVGKEIQILMRSKSKIFVTRLKSCPAFIGGLNYENSMEN